ncbi:schwannomin-interacting protein 1 homolog isoform X2 [Leptopilina boulardi]|nr:schwannomin-interacting protein 1 homolog isoform X2 [Leptopilina boulardi]
MRFKDADISVPSHFVLNNNQSHRNSFDLENLDEVKNHNDPTTIDEEKNADFQIAEDTSLWSSIANSRTNANLDSGSCNNINNIFPVSKLYQSSSTESLEDFEESEDHSHESAPSDWSDWSEDSNVPPGCRGIVNPNYPGFHHLGPSLLSDTDLTEDELDIHDIPRVNKIQDSVDIGNEFNNNIKEQLTSENINQLSGHNFEHKTFYDKPKFNIHNISSLCDSVITPSEKCINYVRAVKISQNEDVAESKVNETVENFTEKNNFQLFETALRKCKTEDSVVEVEIVELMTSVKESLQFPEIEEISEFTKTSEISEDVDLIREAKELPRQMGASITNNVEDSANNTDSESYSEENQPYSKLDEIDLLSSIGRDIGVDLEKYVQPVPDVIAMETVEIRSSRTRFTNAFVKEAQKVDTNKLLDRELPETSIPDFKKKEKMVKNQAKRKEHTHFGCSDKCTTDVENLAGDFDVYNIETAMPKIDLDAIEIHLKAAREEERRRRNDREEIRKRLAMGSDADELKAEKGKKPSLQSRLQNGMNLQICFMNEASSDTESPSVEKEILSNSTSSIVTGQSHQILGRNLIPQVLSLPPLRLDIVSNSAPIDEADFFARQTRLQMEARIALSQAKEMAHMQVEVERQKLKHSPITEMVRSSLAKIGIQLGEERRRLSRMLLTELNVAQLQVLANDLHARIATLNENLVEGLLRRDDLHMEQDSMLVDVEDLTRYLGAKQESLKKKQPFKGKTVSLNKTYKHQHTPNSPYLQANSEIKSQQ